jgi:hypothetical protein
MTLVAHDAGAGEVSRRALALALVQALYFAGTVFHVKSAIRERGSPTFLALGIGEIVATVVVTTTSLLVV